VKENNRLRGQIKDIGRGSRDETQRGVYMGYMMQINMIERNTHPRRGRTSGYLVFCKYVSSVPNLNGEVCCFMVQCI